MEDPSNKRKRTSENYQMDANQNDDEQVDKVESSEDDTEEDEGKYIYDNGVAGLNDLC